MSLAPIGAAAGPGPAPAENIVFPPAAGDGLWLHHVRPDNAKVHGAFLGQRFARFKNLMWMHAGDRNPDANLAECTRVLAREIQAAAPHHLHTVHSAHEFARARFHHEDPWLDVNLGYT